MTGHRNLQQRSRARAGRCGEDAGEAPLAPTRVTAPPLPPRKAPRQKRSAATVAVVLEGAARVLEERGVAGFNTNAVAERAGVSIGTLYQYFPHKDALLAALLRGDAAALLAAVDEAAAPAAEATLETALERLVDVAVRHQAARPRLSQALDAEQRRLLPLDMEAAALAAAVAARIAGALAAHAGRLPGLDPAEAAADLVAIARALVDRDGEAAVPDPAALRRRVRRAVFGYLGLPP